MKISDSKFIEEYRQRFVLPAGSVLSGSEEASMHAHAFLSKYDSSVEYFGIIYLNGRNAVVETEKVASGSLTSATIYPREIIKAVLRYECGAVILFHNHPSGNLQPSQDDIKLTMRLRRALDLLDIKVHDHLIVTPNPLKYFSFSEHELLS